MSGEGWTLAAVPDPQDQEPEAVDKCRAQLDAMLETYELDGTDPASLASQRMADILERYATNRPQDLSVPDPPPVHLLDPVEKYARAVAASSPQVDLRLLLPAAYAAVGGVGQGAYWVAWNGLNSWQVAPATIQMIGLAPSGAGKSTMLGTLNGPIALAMQAGEDAVRGYVMLWADKARGAIAEVLEADRQAAVTAGPEAVKEFSSGERGANKVVDTVVSRMMTGILSTYSDATPEALVSSMIEFGGVGLVKAAEQEVLDNLSRYSQNGSVGSLSAWLDGWDGCGYERSRKGTGVENTSALVLSMILLTQTESFYRSFTAGSGAAWLDKGLIGRALLVAGEVRGLEELITEDLKSLEKATLVAPKAVDKSQISEVMVRIAETGAAVRAARCLEGRVFRTAASVPEAASPIGRKGVVAAGMPGVLPKAAALHEIKDAGGTAGSDLGFVLKVREDDAKDLERMFLWATRTMTALGVPGVVVTALSRWTYHISRQATIRTLALEAAKGEGSWLDFWSQEGGPRVNPGVLWDTAVRQMSWFMSMHLATAGGLQSRAMETVVHQDLLRSGGRDSSMGGLVVESLARVVKSGEATFPLTAHEVTRLVARGHGHDYREGVMSYLRGQWDAAVSGEEGDGYLLMVPGRSKGTMKVSGFGPKSPVGLTPAGAKAAGLVVVPAVVSGSGESSIADSV